MLDTTPSKETVETRIIPSLQNVCADGICEVVSANTGEQVGDPLETFSLFYFDSVTASVGWNKNNDYFLADELYLARHTVINQPLNLEHDIDTIIGHVIDSYLVDENHQRIAPDSPVPLRFHLVSEGVLYKFPGKDPKRQKLFPVVNAIVKEIQSGASRWYVSMECVFSSFDYAVQEPDGSVTIIARTDANKYIDSFLRQKGGEGVYNGKRIGRAMRGIHFIGQGIVRRPASEDSIIFANLDDVGVVNLDNEYFEDKMDTEQLAKLQSDFDALAASYEADKQKWAAEKTAVEAMIDTIKAECQKKSEEAMASLEAVKSEKTSIEAKLAEAVASLENMKAEELKRARLEAIASVGIDVNYDAVATFTNEQFSVFIDTIKSVKEKTAPVDSKSDKVSDEPVAETVATESQTVDTDTIVDEIASTPEQADNLALATVGVNDSRTELASFLTDILNTNKKEEK